MTTRFPGFLDEKEPVREPTDWIEPGQTTIVASTPASEAGAGPDNGAQAVGRAEAHTSGPARTTPLLLDPEEGTPASLGVQWLPERIATPRPSVGSSAWVAAGVATLLAVTLVMSLVSAIITWFAQSLILGSLGAMGLLTGFVLLGVAVARETNAYRSLAAVNALRALLQARTTTPAQARTAAQTWLGRVATRIPDLAGVETAIAGAQTAAEVRAVLRSRVADPLEDLASSLGRRAAAEGAALVAVSPHNSWDGIIAALRGLLLIRQVAALCGLRPGLVVTASLVKHVAWTAAGTSGAAALSQSMADYAVTDMPIIKHLAGAAGAAGVQAFRLHRLAKVTAEACCPVPR